MLTIALLLAVVFVVPLLSHKIHIPSIVGFILVGIALGPQGLDWISNTPTIQMLGQMGILYIMFQAGVEIDINDLKQHRLKALFFGLATFFLPLICGYFGSMALGLSPLTGLLLGAMYGSHTLMTYPMVTRYGLQKNVASNLTVGGTMIALALSLLVLAGVQASTQVGNDSNLLITFAKIIIALVIIVVGLPWGVKAIFKCRLDPIANFILVILALVLSAILSEWAGLSAVLGAFLCGVGLNRLIPTLSPLMNRITFVGNSMFVPVFLLQVGLMINLQACGSKMVLFIALIMIATKLVSKWLAAFVTQRVFHLQPMERQLIFGLSHATAAGTLAIVTIGYQMGFFNDAILNGSILMILVLCTTASFITEHAAKQLALQENARLQSERISDDWLMGSVGEDLHKELKELSNLSSLHETEIVECSDWKEVEGLVEHTSKSIAIYHEVQPLNTIDRMLVLVPRYAEKEHDFISCFGQLRRLSSQIGAKVIFYAHEDTQLILKALCHRPGKYLAASYRELKDWSEAAKVELSLQENDMLVIISSRRSTPSYDPRFSRIPALLTSCGEHFSTMLVYPEQIIGGDIPESLIMDIPQPSGVWKIVTTIKSTLYELFAKLSRNLRS